MEFTYENQGTSTYLVYRIAKEDNVDTLSLGMLTNNKIAGLIPAMFTQMDGERFIKYNVSAKVSVRQFFAGIVNKKRLTGVFSGIVNAMLSAEEYMINPNNILLDLDYIYTDVSTCETNLICLPIDEQQAEAVDLGTLFKSIVFSTQFDQTENCDYVAKIINYLNSAPTFSLENFKTVLDEITAGVQPIRQPPVRQPDLSAASPQLTVPLAVQMPVVSQTPVQKLAVPSTAQQPSVQKQQKVSQPGIDTQEKKISMMTLLTHYNKENKELYKKQREQKKNVEKTGKKSQKKQANVGFAIPGQEIPIGGEICSQPDKMQMAQPTVPHDAVQSSVQQPVASAVQQPAEAVSRTAVNFGETTVLNAGGRMGETTVLSAASTQVEIRPYLLRLKDNSKTLIDKPFFRIGKERSYVDYFIGDNSAISRSHANIVVRGDEYFVVDTNSTNHTYVNGKMIQSNVETKLTQGTKIQFANEEFEFRLY